MLGADPSVALSPNPTRRGQEATRRVARDVTRGCLDFYSRPSLSHTFHSRKAASRKAASVIKQWRPAYLGREQELPKHL